MVFSTSKSPRLPCTSTNTSQQKNKKIKHIEDKYKFKLRKLPEQIKKSMASSSTSAAMMSNASPCFENLCTPSIPTNGHVSYSDSKDTSCDSSKPIPFNYDVMLACITDGFTKALDASKMTSHDIEMKRLLFEINKNVITLIDILKKGQKIQQCDNQNKTDHCETMETDKSSYLQKSLPNSSPSSYNLPSEQILKNKLVSLSITRKKVLAKYKRNQTLADVYTENLMCNDPLIPKKLFVNISAFDKPELLNFKKEECKSKLQLEVDRTRVIIEGQLRTLVDLDKEATEISNDNSNHSKLWEDIVERDGAMLDSEQSHYKEFLKSTKHVLPVSQIDVIHANLVNKQNSYRKISGNNNRSINQDQKTMKYNDHSVSISRNRDRFNNLPRFASFDSVTRFTNFDNANSHRINNKSDQNVRYSHSYNVKPTYSQALRRNIVNTNSNIRQNHDIPTTPSLTNVQRPRNYFLANGHKRSTYFDNQVFRPYPRNNNYTHRR